MCIFSSLIRVSAVLEILTVSGSCSTTLQKHSHALCRKYKVCLQSKHHIIIHQFSMRASDVAATVRSAVVFCDWWAALSPWCRYLPSVNETCVRVIERCVRLLICMSRAVSSSIDWHHFVWDDVVSVHPVTVARVLCFVCQAVYVKEMEGQTEQYHAFVKFCE